MNNPLLANSELPQFSKIQPEHVQPAIEQLLESGAPYRWETLIEPIDAAEDRLNKAWSPVSHMNAVVNNEALRDAYNACLEKLSEYATETGQNRALYQAYQAVHDCTEFATLSAAQQKIINNALRDFHLSGVDLPADKQARYKDISQQLSKLASQFEENLLDATNAWHKLISDQAELSGLPESALAQAKQTAAAEGQQGWMITLQFPSYLAVMTYADNRELRREHYRAFATRASDQSPDADKWDNSEVMERILALLGPSKPADKPVEMA